MEFNLFRFFISGVKKQVVPDSDLWQLPLSGKNCNSDFTTGDYYLAACKFLSDNSFLFLKKGLKFFLNKSVQINQIIRIKIFLEKHGAFYHPLKIEAIVANNQIFSFVLNGAVDKKGLGLIQNEYEILSLMNKNSVKQIKQIEQIAFQIEELIDNTDKEISTNLIGEYIMDKLKYLDKVAYVRFASVYLEFKSLEEFLSELQGLLKKEE